VVARSKTRLRFDLGVEGKVPKFRRVVLAVAETGLFVPGVPEGGHNAGCVPFGMDGCIPDKSLPGSRENIHFVGFVS
jgi:hypothetical protein